MLKEIGLCIREVKKRFEITPNEVSKSFSVPEVFPDYFVWHDPANSGYRELRRKSGGDVSISIEAYEEAVTKRAKQIEDLESRKKRWFFK